MHATALANAATKLKEVADAAMPATEFAGTNEAYLLIARDNAAKVLDNDAVDKFNDILRLFVGEPGWGFAFSEATLSFRLQTIVLKAAIDANFSVSVALQALADDLSSFNESRTVYTPLSGIRLTQPFSIGRVDLVPVDSTLIETLIDEVRTIATANPSPAKEQFTDHIANELRNSLLGATCSKITVVAEPIRAQEHAELETRRALDLLRFATPVIYPPTFRVSLGLKGDTDRVMRHSLLIAEGVDVNLRGSIVGSVVPFQIDDASIRVMEDIGALKMSELLRREPDQLSDFEGTLLRAIHWFSSAQTQFETENQFLDLTTALEALLTPRDNNPIGTAISEGVAFLLANDLVSRQALRSRVKALYAKRSGVSHGGKTKILSVELDELQRIVGSLLTRVIHFHPRPDSQKALLAWIEEQKFS